MSIVGNFIYRWWVGYVVLHMRGKYVERFINQAIRANLEIWDIQRKSKDHFRMKVRLKHFFQLKPILKATDSRMHIVQKHGFPFVVANSKRRKGHLIGFFLFVLLLYLLSSFVWKVEITGVDSLAKGNVLHIAHELGIKKGALKWRLGDISNLQEKLTNRLDEASWVGLKMDGVIAKITIVPKVQSEKINEGVPRHLVAKKKAIVVKYTAEKGAPKVALYQLVQPGDVLISGIIGPEEEPEKQNIVTAKGEVWGETWYESLISIPLNKEYERMTGNTVFNRYVLLGKLKIKVWGFLKDDAFANKKEESTHQYMYLFGRQIPVGFERETIYEVTTEQTSVNEEVAVLTALEMSRKQLMSELEKGSVLKEEKVLQQWVEHGKVYIKAHYTVIEEISKEQIINSP